ncbi:hypothetical protein HNP72_001102 [Sphingobacterium soli]|nr:hypothetical protein [Sphingobacterium soli]
MGGMEKEWKRNGKGIYSSTNIGGNIGGNNSLFKINNKVIRGEWKRN